MSSLEVKARLRREQDILDRIDNVKRLIQMKTTLMTAEDASNYGSYKWYSRSDGKAFGAELIYDLSEVIQLQLLSIVALCNGDNPDLGEPCPMLEWQSMSNKQKNIRQIGSMMCGKSALDGTHNGRKTNEQRDTFQRESN